MEILHSPFSILNSPFKTMPVINCPTCARSIDLPLEYLSIWVECNDCAQQFLPLTGEMRVSVLNERRSFDCQVCRAQFTTYAKVSSNRPRCPKCTSSDTLPSEVAALLKANPQPPKAVEIFNPIDPKLGPDVAKPSGAYQRVKLQMKEKDDRAGFWIVALVTGVILVVGGTTMLLVALVKGKEEKKAKVPNAPPNQVHQKPEPRKEPEPEKRAPELTWKRFASVEGRFRVTMPSPVVERSRQRESMFGTVRESQFLYDQPGASLYYSVSYSDYTPEQLGDNNLEHVIDQVREDLIRTLRGRLQSDKLIELNEYLGREIEIEAHDKRSVLCRCYKAGQRLYVISVMGKGADWGIKDVDAFFDSFEITGTTP
jgi:hypothetical protein